MIAVMKIPKDYQPLARQARRQRWTITPTNNGHLRWQHPHGRSVFTPGSPSTNGTGLIRIIAKLRRAGLKI